MKENHALVGFTLLAQAGIGLVLAAQVLGRLLYRSDPRMVRATYVRGRLCHSLGA